MKYLDSTVLQFFEKEVRKMPLESFKIEELISIHMHAN
jgi:hypothetical protein